MKKVLSVNPCKIDLAKKFSKYLKVLIILCVIIEILVTLGILLLIYQIIASVSVNTIIANIGAMRYHSCLITSNARSLDLLSRNFTLAYNQSTYKNSIYTSSNLLKTYLNQYKIISIPLTTQKMRCFDDLTLNMFTVKDNSVESYQSLLLYVFAE